MKLAMGAAGLVGLCATLAMAQPPAAPPAGAPGAAPGAPGAAPARPRGPGLVMPDAPGGVKPTPDSPGMRQGSTNGVPNLVPKYEDVWATLDALPDALAAKPKKDRRVLVYSKPGGFVHSSIPLTAWTIKLMGEKNGGWQTDISFAQKDITAANLAKYDVLVLNNTTGAFLDDANDAAGTAARRKALLDFVRGGKGLVLTHAGGDTYHGTGVPRPPPGSPPPTGPQPPQKSLWPEFTKMVGGYFKFHWYYPQPVTVKIDDPKSPINAPFNGRPFKIHDEIYTFSNDSYSRKNVHVLTSVDYSKMSAEDKAKENPATKRTDGDYALSWIRREGQGRVYYSVLGHSEHIYFIPNILQSITNGIQYAAGDLAADDSPSEK